MTTFVDAQLLAAPQFGLKLRALRKKRGFTQEDLAREANVSQADVSRAERSPGSVRIAVLARIASAMGTSLEALVTERSVVITPEECGHFNPNEFARLRDAGVLEVARAG